MPRRITIVAKPKAAKNEVVADPCAPDHLTVRTTQPPDKGKANDAIIKMVADHFGVARSRLRIVIGETSRTKIIMIDDD